MQNNSRLWRETCAWISGQTTFSAESHCSVFVSLSVVMDWNLLDYFFSFLRDATVQQRDDQSGKTVRKCAVNWTNASEGVCICSIIVNEVTFWKPTWLQSRDDGPYCAEPGHVLRNSPDLFSCEGGRVLTTNTQNQTETVRRVKG